MDPDQSRMELNMASSSFQKCVGNMKTGKELPELQDMQHAHNYQRTKVQKWL